MNKTNQVIIPFKIEPHHPSPGFKFNTIQDLQVHLQKIFEKADHQDAVIVRLYKMLFPEWNKIHHIEGFPEVGQALWSYICNLFIEFDRLHHPGCLKGGAWINQGFSSNPNLAPWEINLKNCKVIYL